jgi:annexin A7/11
VIISGLFLFFTDAQTTPQTPVVISPGSYPSTGLPHPQLHMQIPEAAPGFPNATPAPAFPQSPYASAQFRQPQPPLIIYNGIPVPNPDAPPAPHGTQKVAGYQPETDYPLVKNAKKSGVFGSNWNDNKREFSPFLSVK